MTNEQDEPKLDRADAEAIATTAPAVHAILERLESALPRPAHRPQPLRAIGIKDFLELNIPSRAMLLDPILPERSLSMLYAPRGVGKSWLVLTMGAATAAPASFLGWSAARPRKVLHVDGEMALNTLQERLTDISKGLRVNIPNDMFQIVAADYTEEGINLSTEKGQAALEPLLDGVDSADPGQPVCAYGMQ
jgi:hypothetical protein